VILAWSAARICSSSASVRHRATHFSVNAVNDLFFLGGVGGAAEAAAATAAVALGPVPVETTDASPTDPAATAPLGPPPPPLRPPPCAFIQAGWMSTGPRPMPVAPGAEVGADGAGAGADGAKRPEEPAAWLHRLLLVPADDGDGCMAAAAAVVRGCSGCSGGGGIGVNCCGCGG
jgi:hypothetical protein